MAVHAIILLQYFIVNIILFYTVEVEKIMSIEETDLA
jgi:hypothetical protein